MVWIQTYCFSFQDTKWRIINHYIGPKIGFTWELQDPQLPFVPAAQPQVLSLRWCYICLVFDKIKDNIMWLWDIAQNLWFKQLVLGAWPKTCHLTCVSCCSSGLWWWLVADCWIVTDLLSSLLMVMVTWWCGGALVVVVVTWHFHHASLPSFAVLTNPDHSRFRPLTPDPDLNICGLRRIFCQVPHSRNVRQLLLLVPSHHLCRYL